MMRLLRELEKDIAQSPPGRYLNSRPPVFGIYAVTVYPDKTGRAEMYHHGKLHSFYHLGPIEATVNRLSRR